MHALDSAVLNFDADNLKFLNLVLAVLMFSIALDLTLNDFRRIARSPKPLLVGLVAQFLLLPALTFLMLLWFRPMPSIAMGLILVAACPGGNISNFFTHRAQGNVALSVSLTAFSTVGAILITPINIAFWGNLYEPTRAILREIHIDPVSVAITIGTVLVLPLVLGMTVNARFKHVADRIRPTMQWLGLAILIAFLVAALSANWSYFWQFAGMIFGLVVAHNAIALAVGYSAATLTGLAPRDRRSITIETGIQNSGLGLVLIFAFFGGLGGMAVVAAMWGVWHLISGMALATLFSRKAVLA